MCARKEGLLLDPESAASEKWTSRLARGRLNTGVGCVCGGGVKCSEECPRNVLAPGFHGERALRNRLALVVRRIGRNAGQRLSGLRGGLEEDCQWE
jgi:hypothetical protein